MLNISKLLIRISIWIHQHFQNKKNKTSIIDDFQEKE